MNQTEFLACSDFQKWAEILIARETYLPEAAEAAYIETTTDERDKLYEATGLVLTRRRSRSTAFGWKRRVTAGLPGLKFHELRHTFVALWVAAGANPKEVSIRAGHSSVAFTLDRYGHLYEDAEDEIPDRLDALLSVSRGAQTGPKSVWDSYWRDRDAL
jgi:integrase